MDDWQRVYDPVTEYEDAVRHVASLTVGREQVPYTDQEIREIMSGVKRVVDK